MTPACCHPILCMSHRPIRIPRVIFAVLFSVWTVAGLAAPDEPAAAQVELEPPRLAQLARSVLREDASQQWEFSSVVLDALLHMYSIELRAAKNDRAETPRQKRKLARWQKATGSLMEQIESLRTRLSQGSPFTLYVDGQNQILLVVDGETISISGPHPDAERELERYTLSQFCAYHDCSFLKQDAQLAIAWETPDGGNWVFRQHRRPAYEVNNLVRCEFETLLDRLKKAQTCYGAAADLEHLIAALQKTQASGYSIDWNLLANQTVAADTNSNVQIDRSGNSVQVAMPTLSRISQIDWQNLVMWLRQGATNQGEPLIIDNADQLIARQE